MTPPAIQKPTPNHVSLLSRKQVSFSEAGLTGVEGAREVIAAISCRKQVTTLALSHNHLGDEGCIELFSYLCSSEGRKYQITDISLVHNHLRDRSLLAISEYIRGNTSLKELWLQYNAFSGAQDDVIPFVEALNSSRVAMLTFSTNRGDGDALISHLLNTLDSPTLQEIHFSMATLTYGSVPHIVQFVSSPRCRAHTVRASGNKLGVRGVREIIETVERSNFSLLKFDLFANGLEEGEADTDVEERNSAEALQKLSARLKAALSRNDGLRRKTEKDAFVLLRHARSVLLRTSGNDSTTRYPSLTPRLPIELQLHVLSFLAPHLSTSQRLRIFNFASTSSTLPRLAPTPSGPGCIPDPASMAFGGPGCASGKCMGTGNSLMCRREGERLKWLAEFSSCISGPL
ncbi:unnamed protein product [Somion occarium]|uniref:RNI-like protein n=1 Tax=Somion occarium TaxID=3059160 RepID=A0ABP1CW12_9APHY